MILDLVAAAREKGLVNATSWFFLDCEVHGDRIDNVSISLLAEDRNLPPTKCSVHFADSLEDALRGVREKIAARPYQGDAAATRARSMASIARMLEKRQGNAPA
jgi:hypothetical protein